VNAPPDSNLAYWIECAQSQHPGRRRAAAAALGQSGDGRAIGPLTNLLAETRADVVRAAAALRCLGEANLAGAVTALWKGDPTPALRLRDARLGGPLVTMLGSRSARRRAAAAEALGSVPGEAPVGPLVLALYGDPNASVRRAAARSLGRVAQPGALRPLLDSLLAEDPGLRREVVSALGALGDPLAVDPLVERLQDHDVETRRRAAVALGRLGEGSRLMGQADERALDALSLALKKDRSHVVRESAARALGMIRSPAALPALIDALDNPNDEVTAAAARALGQIGDPAALPKLREARAWWEQGPVKEACREATRAILRAIGRYGSELSPAPPPKGRATEVAPTGPDVGSELAP
jgi:HEAT repeat protein